MSSAEYDREYYERNREARLEYKRQHYAANREAIRERQKRYEVENAEKIRARKQARYAQTREERRQARKVKYEANREIILATQRERRARPDYDAAAQAERVRSWHRRNPNARAEHSQLRRARLQGVAVEVVERDMIWSRDDGTCRICGEPAIAENWHLDHIVPIAKGGGHTFDNLAVTHPACNLKKSAADPREPGSPYAYLLEPEAS